MLECSYCRGMIDNRTKRKGHPLTPLVEDGPPRAIHDDCAAKRKASKARLLKSHRTVPREVMQAVMGPILKEVARDMAAAQREHQ